MGRGRKGGKGNGTIYHIFRPTTQKVTSPAVVGFDIETCDDNKTFLCASMVGGSESNLWEKVFTDKESFITELLKKKHRGTRFVASNLGFDFFGIMYGDPRISGFNTLFRDSNLILAWTYVKDGKFHRKRLPGAWRLDFIDTFNYCPFSVEKLGKVIGISKLDKPDFLGERPKDKAEWNTLIEYNVRDSTVSKLFIDFLFNAMRDLGATPKITIASSAKSLYTNKYLKNDYFRHSPAELMEQFNAYYGGRTEAFIRGTIKDYNYYDINSLYPYVMKSYPYPDPNKKRICFKDTLSYIKRYPGCSKVDVTVPRSMMYPPLPFRAHKVLFPTGRLTGWWCHNELVYAMEMGCRIEKVYKTYYFKGTCRPFEGYVTDLYAKRLQYKREGNPMEVVVKLFMNSLYGKFGQRFTDLDNVIPFNHTPEELGRLGWFERIGDYLRVKQSFIEPPASTIPIWAAYVTSYARMELHKLLVKYRPAYCDTDSILTKQQCPTSSDLGALKLEMQVEEGIVVKPKFYAIRRSERDPETGENLEHVKIKGLGTRIRLAEFMAIISDDRVDDDGVRKFTKSYDKFVRFKEALRRGLVPNEIVEMTKKMTLDDDKRVWEGGSFDYSRTDTSRPIFWDIYDGVQSSL